MTRCLEASINLLQRRRFGSTCGTAQIDGKVLRREYRLYGVALLCPETCLRFKVIVATQGDNELKIKGISKDVLERYSQRSEQRDESIRQFAAEHGRQPT